MMFRRGLALCLVLGLASFARAQTATISFSPNGGSFAPNAVVNVDVLVTQGNGATKSLRYAQLDYSATPNATLKAAVSLPTTHSGATIKGFDFNSVGAPNCSPATSATCGTGHYIEDDLLLRPNILAIAYTLLAADANKQIELPNNTAVKIATLRLTMPGAIGNYGKLDVVNAAGGVDAGGELRWGFGITGDTELIKLRAAAGLLGGISNDFVVTDIGPIFVTALPAPTATGATIRVMSRTTRNEARLDFNANLPAPVAGGVRIREMLAAGAFGGDIAANFTQTLGDAATPGVDTARLILKDNASNLVHRKWYQVESTGTWPTVGAFCLQFVVQAGDCDGSGAVAAADLTCINAKIPTNPANAALDANFTDDINGAGGIAAADLTAANAQIPSGPVAKPTGHTTCP